MNIKKEGEMHMSIDEQATIQSILESLKSNSINEVAKHIEGISKDPLGRALNKAGYKYSNTVPKGWHFIGEGAEPLDKSIFDYHIKKGITPKKPSSPKVHAVSTQSNIEVMPSSPAVHAQFTGDEVNMIKKMLKEWQAPKVFEINTGVHDRIKEIPQTEKTRKTIVIDKVIGKRLDDYCEAERINKSDVLYLALQDFLDNHQK